MHVIPCLPEEGCAHESPGCGVLTFDTTLNPEGSWLLASEAFSPTLFRLALSSASGPVPQPLLLQKGQAGESLSQILAGSISFPLSSSEALRPSMAAEGAAR